METSFMQLLFPRAGERTGCPGAAAHGLPVDWKKWASGWADARQVILGYNGDPAVEARAGRGFLNDECRLHRRRDRKLARRHIYHPVDGLSSNISRKYSALLR
jgi:hypothetical protein